MVSGLWYLLRATGMRRDSYYCCMFFLNCREDPCWYLVGLAIQRDQASQAWDGFEHERRSMETLFRGIQRARTFRSRWLLSSQTAAEGGVTYHVIYTSIRARMSGTAVSAKIQRNNHTAAVEQLRIVVATTTNTVQVRVVMPTCDVRKPCRTMRPYVDREKRAF